MVIVTGPMPEGLHASSFLSKLRVLFSGQIVE
jgi:hypothetical protein